MDALIDCGALNVVTWYVSGSDAPPYFDKKMKDIVSQGQQTNIHPSSGRYTLNESHFVLRG